MSHEAGRQELSGWLSVVSPALSTVSGTHQAPKKYVQQTMSPLLQPRASLLTGAPEATRARAGWEAPPGPTGGLRPSPQQGFSWSPAQVYTFEYWQRPLRPGLHSPNTASTAANRNHNRADSSWHREHPWSSPPHQGDNTPLWGLQVG